MYLYFFIVSLSHPSLTFLSFVCLSFFAFPQFFLFAFSFIRICSLSRFNFWCFIFSLFPLLSLAFFRSFSRSCFLYFFHLFLFLSVLSFFLFLFQFKLHFFNQLSPSLSLSVCFSHFFCLFFIFPFTLLVSITDYLSLSFFPFSIFLFLSFPHFLTQTNIELTETKYLKTFGEIYLIK